MKLHVGREDDQSSANTLIRDDPKFASHKIAFFQYATIAVFLFLITGFWDLQIRNPEVYQERALENSVKSIPVLAPRGKILDRDGRVIVDNHSSFSLYLSRENLKMEHLRPIAHYRGSIPQRGRAMYLSNQSLLVILVVGIVAGYLAGRVMEGGGFGLIGDLLVGL